MGKTIAIFNRKGGVGKTTTALCFCDCLRQLGQKTLLVDLDQQHNATSQYGADIEGVTTIYDVLTDIKVDITEAIQQTSHGQIIAGDDLINQAENQLASMPYGREVLKIAFEQIKNGYDYIVIDCSPVIGQVATAVLAASDEVIVPMLADGFSVEAFEGIREAIEQIKISPTLNPDLKISGMLLTMYEGSQKLAKSYDEQLPSYAQECGTKVYLTKIRRCCKVKESQVQGQSLYEYAPDCTTAMDYKAFTEEFLEGEKNG